jgi:SAM-dependent methyltransferase
MRNLLVSLTKRWGSLAAKQRVWNSEYKRGKWDYISEKQPVAHDQIYEFLNRYAREGRVLDLGCGTGVTALEMTSGFSEYVGVDVSNIAIENANRLASLDLERGGKIQFHVGEIASFVPTGQFAVILFRESLYYIPLQNIRKTLIHYSSFLSRNGVFIVRLCNRHKYIAIIDLLNKDFDIEEKWMSEDSNATIVVCRSQKLL